MGDQRYYIAHAAGEPGALCTPSGVPPMPSMTSTGEPGVATSMAPAVGARQPSE